MKGGLALRFLPLQAGRRSAEWHNRPVPNARRFHAGLESREAVGPMSVSESHEREARLLLASQCDACMVVDAPYGLGMRSVALIIALPLMA